LHCLRISDIKAMKESCGKVFLEAARKVAMIPVKVIMVSLQCVPLVCFMSSMLGCNKQVLPSCWLSSSHLLASCDFHVGIPLNKFDPIQVTTWFNVTLNGEYWKNFISFILPIWGNHQFQPYPKLNIESSCDTDLFKAKKHRI